MTIFAYERRQASLKKWLADVSHSADYKPTDREILEMYIGIRGLIDGNYLSDLDEQFSVACIQVSRMPEIVMVALLRYSFIRRNALPHWWHFLEAVKAEYNKRGLPHQPALHGLVATDT